MTPRSVASGSVVTCAKGRPHSLPPVVPELDRSLLDPDVLDAISDGVADRLADRLSPAPSPLLDIREAAEYLAVSVRTVESLVALGEIPVVRIGTGRGVRRFERRSLDAFVRRSARAL